MRIIFLMCLILGLISCNKNVKTETDFMKDTLRKIDSMNAVIAKHNDSIKVLNNKNRFADISGTHKLTFSSGIANFSGSVKLTKIGRDLYEVSGGANSGKNQLKINGNIKRVSDKHLNFEGKIVQNINGIPYTRSKKTTFFDEGKGKFWRLQNKMNSEGFIEYIDMHF